MQVLNTHFGINQSVFFISALFISLFLSSCNLTHVPQKTFTQRQSDREKKIEKYMEEKSNVTDKYESLGFGPLKVYKPHVFAQLDSLYEIKYTYEQENRIGEFKKTDIPDQIEELREVAKEAEENVEYELEHIYSLTRVQKLTIFHDFFLLDKNDSILRHSPHYKYRIPLEFKDIQLKYLFELHFLTEKPIVIRNEELNFIRFFKEREEELIGSIKLQRFMMHTLNLMTIAEQAKTVDFVKLAEILGKKKILTKHNNVKFKENSELYVDESEYDEIVNYAMEFSWINQESLTEHTTLITFSPYLEIEKMEDLDEN